MALWPEAVLFDLDGTLIDSVPDIAAAINELLMQHELPQLTIDDVRGMIGNGVGKLVERAFAHFDQALSVPDHRLRVAEMMAIYPRHLTNFTREIEGASPLLAGLRELGKKIAIVTNKPEAFVAPIIAHFGWSIDFVVGGDRLPTRKPDPQMLLYACERLGVRPNQAVMIGDGPADIGAAKAVPMKSIVLRGGYTRVPVEQLGATCVIDHLRDVSEVLERIA